MTKEKPGIFWEKLKLSYPSSKEKVDKAFKQSVGDPLSYLAWKVLRDPFYQDLYNQSKTYSSVVAAGFFDDKLSITPEPFLKYLTTPLHKISRSKDLKHKKPLILLSTGAFSPLHDGHIEMMEIAKQSLESSGHVVLGGFLSPSHDGYVNQKYGGEASCHSEERIANIEKQIVDHSWLMVDSWESRYTSAPVNFTDVIIRLKNYIHRHLGIKVEIAYVFGSDNSGFANAFLKRGLGVCVEREGFPIPSHLRLAKNVIFTSGGLKNHLSSSSLRSVSKFKWTFKPLTYLVRNDVNWAESLWIKSLSQTKNESYWQKAIAEILLYSKQSAQNKIIFLSVEEQLSFVRGLKDRVINLDPVTSAGRGFGISRLFYISDAQVKSNLLVARPGYPPLPEQISKIEKGNFALLDDDIGSGQTMRQVKELLPEPTLIIEDFTLASQFYNKINPRPLSLLSHDVLDIRDFIVGSRDGGLVVKLPNGSLARAPYMLPYVSLVFRAKCPPSVNLELSKKLWQINFKYFKSNPKILVKDTDPAFQNLFRLLGFSKTTPMYKVCKWHLALFT